MLGSKVRAHDARQWPHVAVQHPPLVAPRRHHRHPRAIVESQRAYFYPRQLLLQHHPGRGVVPIQRAAYKHFIESVYPFISVPHHRCALARSQPIRLNN